MKCGDCKYFGNEITISTLDDDFEEKKTGYHECKYIQHREDEYSNNYEKPVFCVDASGYFAAVRVREDFGCAAFEKKQITDDFSLRVDIE